MASRNTTDLHEAIASKDWSTVRRLIDEHPELLNVQDELGDTPLIQLKNIDENIPADVVADIANKTQASVTDIQHDLGDTPLIQLKQIDENIPADVVADIANNTQASVTDIQNDAQEHAAQHAQQSQSSSSTSALPPPTQTQTNLSASGLRGLGSMGLDPQFKEMLHQINLQLFSNPEILQQMVEDPFWLKAMRNPEMRSLMSKPEMAQFLEHEKKSPILQNLFQNPEIQSVLRSLRPDQVFESKKQAPEHAQESQSSSTQTFSAQYLEMLQQLEAQDFEMTHQFIESPFCQNMLQNPEILRLSLTCNPQALQLKEDGWTELMIISCCGFHHVVRNLIDAKTAIDPVNKDGRTALHLSATRGHIDVCRLLIESGAKKDIQDKDGRTALYMSAVEGHTDVCRLLIESGANTEIQDKYELTALHVSAHNGHTVICSLLIDPDANKDIQDENGRTALHLIATHGHIDVCRLLIESGANKDIQDENGRTALHLNATHGHIDICRLLIESGANKDIQDKNGCSEMHMAALEGHTSIIQLLLQAGGRVLLTKNKQNPLHFCFANPCLAFHEYLEVSVALLKQDRKLAFAKDKENRSPIAMYESHTFWKYQDPSTAQKEKKKLVKILRGGPLPLIELDESPPVTNRELISMSHKLQINWMKFGKYFGFRKEDLNLIDKSYNSGNKRCLRMLKLWMLWKKDSDGFMETINALKACDATEIPVEILARGPEAWRLFQVAIEGGHMKVNMTPIRIIGQECTGKSCLKNSLLGKKFNKEHIITDAIATTTFSCINNNGENEWEEYEGEVDGKSEDIVVHKIVEQLNQKERFDSRIWSDGKSEDIVVHKIVEQLNQKKSISTPETDGPNTSPKATTDKHFASSSAPVQGTQQLLQRTQSKGISYTKGIVQKVESGLESETGVLKPEEVFIKIWDYGGQPIYHSIHRLYMKPLGIYIATFKLTDDLDAFARIQDSSGNFHKYHMTNLELILYWISSPYNHCSVSKRDAELGLDLPVSIVVGTHLHSLAGSKEEKKAKVKQIFEKIRKAIEDKPYESHVYPIYFDVENQLSSSDENICKLKEAILKIRDKMKKPIPITWLQFLIAILKIGEEKLILPLEKVKMKARECGIRDDKTIELAIQFFSDVGEISFYPKEEALRDLVVLKPMDLVEYVKTVFTVKMPEHMPGILQKEWRNLEKGILRKNLLQHLWQKFPIFADDKDEEMFDFFVNLMKKFGLICGGNTTSESGDQVFYAFPHLQPTVTDHVSLKCDEPDGNGKVSIFHDFCGYLPDHLFQLACTRLIEQVQVEQTSELKLEYNHIEMDFDECHLVSLSVATIKHRRMFKTTITRRQTESAPNVDEPKPETCRKVLALLNGVLEYLRHTSSRRGIRYKTCLPCSDNSDHMHFVENFNREEVPCGRFVKSIARYCRLFRDSTPTHTSQCCLDDKALLCICNALDNNWRSLGIHLEISAAVIECIVDDNRHVKDAIMATLVEWRNQQSSDANQVSVMSDALKQAGYVHIAERMVDAPTCHSGVLHDNDLLSISDGLGTNWKRFGVNLGLLWQSMQMLESQHRDCVEDACMSMLTMWRNQQSVDTNQVDFMIKLLSEQGYSAVADRLGRNMDSEGKLSNGHLFYISKHTCSHWKQLAGCLGLTWTEIKSIASEYHGRDASMEMLTIWRTRQSRNINQLDVMCRSLKDEDFNDVADQLKAKHAS